MSTPMPSTVTRAEREQQGAATTVATRSRSRTDIQALRALSVLLVVGYHLWPGRLTGGFIGVDVFFVISGFLITGHLAREADRDGRVSLATFWTRRAFRLLPAALLVIVLTTLAMFAWAGENVWRAGLHQALGSAFYVQNWVLSSTATDYLSSTEPPTAFQHFWSLSVEEQFYLVLPLLLVAVLAVSSRRTWRARFVVVVGAVTLASFAWSVHLTATDSAAAYFVTTTRTWEFGIGALLVLLGQDRLHKVPPAIAWVGLAAILVAAGAFTAGTAFPGYAAALPTLGGALVLATVRHDRVWNAVADSRPVQLIGNASYSIYLWHWPVFIIVPWLVGHPLGFAPRALILLGSIGIGWASMRFVEAPLRPRGAVTWRGRSGTIVIGGIATALVIGTSGLGLVRDDAARAQRHVAAVLMGADACVGAPALGRDECSAPTELTPSLALLRDDNGTDSRCWATRADPVVHRCVLAAPKNPRKRVYAVGDSHLAALDPALVTAGKKLGWHIESAAKEGCYLAAGRMPIADPVRRTTCKTWRHTLLDQIVADTTIDTVLVTRYDLNLVDGDNRAATVQGLQTAWRRIVGSGKTVLVLQDVPRADQSVLDCVSEEGVSASTSCAVPEDKAFPSWTALRAASTGIAGVTFVPTADTFCADRKCPPVIGGVPVFRNVGHLSKTFVSTWGPELAARLDDATA